MGVDDDEDEEFGVVGVAAGAGRGFEISCGEGADDFLLLPMFN